MICHADPLLLFNSLAIMLEQCAIFVLAGTQIDEQPQHWAVRRVEVVAVDLERVRLTAIRRLTRLPIRHEDDDVLREPVGVPVAMRRQLER